MRAEVENALFMSRALLDKVKRHEKTNTPISQRELTDMVFWLRKLLEESMNVAANGWQPIATAPKDGREILCTWVRELEDGRRYWAKAMHVLSWWPNWHSEGVGAWVLDGDFAVRFKPDGFHETPPTGNWEPTHWMPLPAPPTDVRDEAAVTG